MQATLKVPNKKVIKRTQSVGAVEAVLKKAIFILAYCRYVASRAYIKTVRCRLSIRPSVCLSQGQRARQQQSRASAGDAHRWLPRKYWPDCKEDISDVLANFSSRQRVQYSIIYIPLICDRY